MYNVNENYLSTIKKSSRTIASKVTFGDIEFTDADIVSFSIEDSFSNNELPGIGGVVASRLKLKLLNSPKIPTYITTQKIRVYTALEVKEKNPSGEIITKLIWIQSGLFYPDLDSITKTDMVVEIECTDELTHYEKSKYDSKLTFPTSATNIVNELAKEYGIAIGDISLLDGCTVKVKPENTVRGTLAEIAELSGANATMDREGKLTFRRLKKVNFTLDANNYSDFKLLSDDKSNITKLICEKSGTIKNGDKEEEIPDLEIGDTKGATLRFENDSVTTKEELQAIYNKFMPISYYPYELKCQGMPHLDCGDIITLIDKKDVEREVYILNHTLEYNGGMMSSFKAGPVKTENKAGSNGSNSISDSINTVVKNQIIVNEILAGNITADNIHANAITTDKLTAKCVTADKIAAKSITADHIQADAINAGHIQAGSITAEEIKAGSITAGSGIIADGAIGSAQISTLDAAKITSGTIDTSDVTIAGANGNLRLKNNRLQVFEGMGSMQKERVSIGDVNADGTVFGLRVRGKDGKTVLLDENGVKSEGITDGSITNDKINPSAGIEGGKLDIDSVIETINKDGSKTINSVRIEVDSKSLSATIQEINDKSKEQDKNITTNTASIKANANAINLKVDEQSYKTDKENMTTQMSKNTSSIEMLKDSINLKVSQTDIDNSIIDNNKAIDKEMNKKLEEVKTAMKKEVDDVGASVSDLETNMNTAFKDELLTEAEKKQLKLNVKDLEKEKADVLAQVNTILNTKELVNTAEFTELTSNKDKYNASHSNLVAEINKIINTAANIDLNSFFNDYKTKLEVLRVSMEKASAKIAQIKADKAKEEAKGYTDTNVTTITDKIAEIEIKTDSITQRVQQTESTTTNIKADVKKAQEDASSAKANALKGIEDAKKAQDLANSANTNASNANNSANAANVKLNDMSSDSKLTALEKQQTKKEVDIIVSEKAGIIAEANKFSVNNADYVSKYNDLNAYIAPLLKDLSSTSDIVGATFRSHFTNYYNARQTVLNAISSKAKSLADNAKTQADKGVEDAKEAMDKANVAQKTASSNTTKLSSIETNLGSITSRVSSVETKQSDIGGKVTSLETRIGSAEQKITKEAITGIVKETSLTKAESEKIKKAQDALIKAQEEAVKDVDGKLTNESKDRIEEAKRNLDTALKKADDVAAKADKNYSEVKQGLEDWTINFNGSRKIKVDATGMDIYSGGLRLKNNSNQTVLGADGDGNLVATGRIETVKREGRLILNGNTLNGYRGSENAPIYSAGVWKPYSEVLGYVSVSRSKADGTTDGNGALWMSPTPKEQGNGCELTYSRRAGGDVSGLRFNQGGGVEFRCFGPDKQGIGAYHYNFDSGISCYGLTASFIKVSNKLFTEYNDLLLQAGGINNPYSIQITGGGYLLPNGNMDFGDGNHVINKIVYRNYQQVSDRRDKEEIEYINVLDDDSKISTFDMYKYIKDSKLATYKYKDRRDNNDGKQIGVIAQDVIDTEIGSYIVNNSNPDHYTVNVGNRVGVIEGALQVAIDKIETLETKNMELKNENEELRSRLKLIESKLGLV